MITIPYICSLQEDPINLKFERHTLTSLSEFSPSMPSVHMPIDLHRYMMIYDLCAYSSLSVNKVCAAVHESDARAKPGSPTKPGYTCALGRMNQTPRSLRKGGSWKSQVVVLKGSAGQRAFGVAWAGLGLQCLSCP